MLEEKVLAIIEEICEDDVIYEERDINLKEEGLMDSLAFVELLVRMEEFGIEVAPTEVTYEEIDTPNKIIHYIVSDGLRNYIASDNKILSAMRSITTHNIDCLEYLKKCEDNSFDIIYFDPMFSHNIKESMNLSGIEPLADYNFPTKVFLEEARRVAKNKIIVKAHFRDNIFEKYNFKRIIRKNTKFHYGFIDFND